MIRSQIPLNNVCNTPMDGNEPGAAGNGAARASLTSWTIGKWK